MLLFRPCGRWPRRIRSFVARLCEHYFGQCCEHFFPGPQPLDVQVQLFDQWLKRHRLPTTLHPMFQEFLPRTVAPACYLAGAIFQTELGNAAKGQVYFTKRLGPLPRGSPSQSHPLLFSVGCVTHGDDPALFRALKARQTNGDRKCWKKFQRTSPDGIPGVSANQLRCQEAQAF